jgi:type 2 lantibiotic biosynthesis protein LanM
MAAQAIRGQDGSVTWIAPQMNFQAGRFILQRLDFGLYDGVAGLVLFLAALEHVTGRDDLHDLACGAIEPLQRALQQPDSRRAIVRTMGIGGSGLGGVLYTLALSGKLLRDEAMITEACRMTDLLVPELTNSLSPHDVLAGMAGAILGLLALHGVTRENALLEKGRRLGRAVLEGRVPRAGGHRTWPSFKNVLLTGFSHGAAGIAYALARLYQAGGGDEFLAAAQEAIAFERSVFDRTAKNWPDFTAASRGPADGPAQFRSSWCHGAPGIGLGRLGGLDVLDNPTVREDIEAALDTTAAFGLQDMDFLCCGNLGRTETLLSAARQLGRPELETAVQTQVMSMVKRARRRGTFALHPQLPREIYNPGFFTGTSGVGYMLLRVACPDRLPSVLRLE